MTDTHAALAHACIELKDKTPGDHRTTCPQCSHTRHNKHEPCLSVTIEPDGTPVWVCHHCGWGTPSAAEDLEYYRALHGNEAQSAQRGSPARARTHTREAKPPVKPKFKAGTMPESGYRWFKKRGIGKAIVDLYGVTVRRHWIPAHRKEVDCIAFPYRRAGEVVNVKYRSGDKHFAQEKGAEKVFFGLDTCEGKTEVIIVEGELDLLALAEAGLGDWYGLLSVPDGAPQKVADKEVDPEDDAKFDYVWNCRDVIDAADKVILAVDADGPGKALEEELARRIGKEKCWRVQWPTANDIETKDANETLVDHGPEVLVECVKRARAYPIKSLFDLDRYETSTVRLFRDGRERGLSTGFGNLDKLISIVPGQMSVVTGYPTSGKSEVVDAIAVNMAQLHGWKFGLCSFENTPEDHIAKICEKYLGMPFWHGMGAPRMGEGDLRRAMAWGNEHFYFIRAEDESPTIDWVLETARAAVMRYGIKGLILDPYNEFEHKRPKNQNETEYISELLSKVKRFAGNHGVHVWFVAHPAKPEKMEHQNKAPSLMAISGSAHWTNKADIGLSAHRAWNPDGTRSSVTEVHVKKVRFRHQGEPGVARLQFKASTGQYTEALL